jgi:hypothetical protein
VTSCYNENWNQLTKNEVHRRAVLKVDGVYGYVVFFRVINQNINFTRGNNLGN